MEYPLVRELDSFGWIASLLAGLVVGGIVALAYDGPFELLPIAAALLVVAVTHVYEQHLTSR